MIILQEENGMKQLYDVIIIGGGVVGSAIAREMSRYRLKIGVLKRIWMYAMRPAAEIPAWSMADLPMTQAH